MKTGLRTSRCAHRQTFRPEQQYGPPHLWPAYTPHPRFDHAPRVASMNNPLNSDTGWNPEWKMFWTKQQMWLFN
eukprot:8470964-Alexandrium_andersonii.AAC.1